jgi:hypothetical protein
MTFFNLNLDRYRAWTIQQLYYLLYPYIKDDFMGRQDCQAVHTLGNMIAGDATVAHVTFSGGDDTLANIKEREYELLAEEGGVTLSTAQETGETTGFRE